MADFVEASCSRTTGLHEARFYLRPLGIGRDNRCASLIFCLGDGMPCGFLASLCRSTAVHLHLLGSDSERDTCLRAMKRHDC